MSERNSPDMSTPSILLTNERPIVPPLVLTDIKMEEPSRDDDIKTTPVMKHHHQLSLTLLPVLFNRQSASRFQSLPRAAVARSSPPPPFESFSSSQSENNRRKKNQVSEKPALKMPLRRIIPLKSISLENKMEPQEKKQRSRKSKPDILLCHICGEIARSIIKSYCMTCRYM